MFFGLPAFRFPILLSSFTFRARAFISESYLYRNPIDRPSSGRSAAGQLESVEWRGPVGPGRCPRASALAFFHSSRLFFAPFLPFPAPSLWWLRPWFALDLSSGVGVFGWCFAVGCGAGGCVVLFLNHKRSKKTVNHTVITGVNFTPAACARRRAPLLGHHESTPPAPPSKFASDGDTWLITRRTCPRALRFAGCAEHF